jgi:TrmH family RNA methyltransferase
MLTSLHNPKVKLIASLRERRTREATGLVRVEGYDEVRLALASGATPADLLYCPPLFPDGGQAALLEEARRAGARLIEVDERVFRRLAYREHPDGWLGTFHWSACRLDELHLEQRAAPPAAPPAAPLVVVVQGLEKPGNLGAILRTADAAGASAVVACDARTDWGNPNVVRASKGALFAIPVATASSEEALDWLHRQQIRVVAATPSATRRYDEVDLAGPVAIVVGAEDKGVSREWLAAADDLVQIPMAGRVNSLNVSAAAAILLYEAVRQRMRHNATRGAG